MHGYVLYVFIKNKLTSKYRPKYTDRNLKLLTTYPRMKKTYLTQLWGQAPKHRPGLDHVIRVLVVVAALVDEAAVIAFSSDSLISNQEFKLHVDNDFS